MRILRYWKNLQFEPWASFNIVAFREVKASDLSSKPEWFDLLVTEVKASGFNYVVIDQPDEILIERSQP